MRFLLTPPAFDAPVRGVDSRQNIAIPFGIEILEWLGYPTVRKTCLFVLTEFTNVTDTQTDKQTHRHRMTAEAALMNSIARQ